MTLNHPPPSPGLLPRTPEDRMEEVTGQAKVSTQNGSINSDMDWLAAHADLQKWRPHPSI